MPGKYDDFYKSLRARIQEFVAKKGAGYKYAGILLVGPDLFHLMCRLALDKRISTKNKALLGAAIAYFVSPADLIPEGLVGPVGYIDDIAVAALALNSVINDGGGEVAQEHWVGDGDVLNVIQEVLKVADEMVGSGLWERIRRMFSR